MTLVTNAMKLYPRKDSNLRQRILVITICIVLGQLCAAARTRGRPYGVSKGCEFPSKWSGTWFQKGVQPPIKIEKDIFSFKGKCLSAENHMFFIEDSKENCFRCVVMYEKHPNVLQYRETFCDSYKTLHQACDSINADAPLYSMFRVDAKPVPCILRGPYKFTYSRGHGECRYPVSTIDSCTDDSHLLFRFQACADVLGTESSVEELSCLAVWKEGASHYLVGKMSNKKHYGPPFSDDNSYRCFVFDYLQEKGVVVQMSQSADATCDGLVSPWEGSRTMRLQKSQNPQSDCQFPPWVTTAHKWHTLDEKKSYSFSRKNNTFRLTHTDHLDTKFTCTEEVSSSANSSTYVAYSISGCKNGYVCIKFYRRHKHIIEVQMGDLARRSLEACQPVLIDSYSQEFVTLVGPSPANSGCPKLVETNGLRVQIGKVEECRDTAMVVGCREHDSIQFLTRCASTESIKSYHCHGNWEENGRSYLITGLRDANRKYCFVYWTNDKTTHLSGIHDTCRRTIEPGITGNFSYNISSAGHCDSLLTNSAAATSSHHPLSSVFSSDISFLALLSLFLLR